MERPLPMLPYLSVIIPVRNERQWLPQLVDCLLAQDYPPELYEILIVDGRSKDGTGELIARRYSKRPVRVRVLDNAKLCAAAGRNVGIRAAAGDAMIFLSGRCAISPKHYLADVAQALEMTPQAACFGSPQPLLAPSATRMGEAIARVEGSWLGRRADLPDLAGFMEMPCGATIYRRGVFEKVGFFDEDFEACEAEDFNMRAWKSVIQGYCDPRLTVHERPCTTIRELWRQMISYGRGTSRLMRKHPEHSQVAQVAPLGVLLAFLLGLLAWNQLPVWMAAVTTLPLMLFPGAMFVATAQLGTRYGIRTALRAPWIFAAIYGGQGIGLFWEYAFPARSREKRGAGVLVETGASVAAPGASKPEQAA
jgi:succinoglycan biosynthesis protein ExoA